jgi:hypothetical protein
VTAAAKPATFITSTGSQGVGEVLVAVVSFGRQLATIRRITDPERRARELAALQAQLDNLAATVRRHRGLASAELARLEGPRTRGPLADREHNWAAAAARLGLSGSRALALGKAALDQDPGQDED